LPLIFGGENLNLPVWYDCGGENKSYRTGSTESNRESDEDVLLNLVKAAVPDFSEQRVEILVDTHGAENKLGKCHRTVEVRPALCLCRELDVIERSLSL
jgi:hypothetical protein